MKTKAVSLSEYCRSQASKAFADLISKMRCNYLVVSYKSDLLTAGNNCVDSLSKKTAAKVNEMKELNYQWQGAQGCKWWELNLVQDKFSESENGHELLIKLSDCFTVRIFTVEKAFERWYKNEQDFYWSEIHINNVFCRKSCEHIDEDLYWLFDNLYNLVFIQCAKKNRIKPMLLKRFEKRKEKILAKPNVKVFTVSGEVYK